MNNIDLNIFRLEVFNKDKETHLECIEELNCDKEVEKYLGNLFYMIDRINLRRKENLIDQIYVVYFQNQIIGFISISILEDEPYISYALLDQYRGESLGSLLLLNFTTYLQDYYHFVKIYMQIDKENERSKAIAKFLGYEHEKGKKYFVKR